MRYNLTGISNIKVHLMKHVSTRMVFMPYFILFIKIKISLDLMIPLRQMKFYAVFRSSLGIKLY